MINQHGARTRHKSLHGSRECEVGNENEGPEGKNPPLGGYTDQDGLASLMGLLL